MKIDAPRAFGYLRGVDSIAREASFFRISTDDIPVRIVRESDWRRIMAVVKAKDYAQFVAAQDALRKHLEKRSK